MTGQTLASPLHADFSPVQAAPSFDSVQLVAHSLQSAPVQDESCMFAPEAPRTDMTIVIDAKTVDGRHVDPYNAVVSDVADPGLRRIPARLGLDAFSCDYTARIPWERLYHDVFANWLFAYHERTGRWRDRIVSFDAYVIEGTSPAPGGHEPGKARPRVFLSRP